MFIADYHTHCNFSSDSDTPMENIVRRAMDLGLKQLALTDHLDYDYPNLDFPFLIDYDEYSKTFFRLKEKYNNEIKLIFGVEIGLQPHLKQQIDDLLNKYNFDFIIASTHVVDKLDLYNGDFFKNKTKQQAYLLYFEDILNNIKIYNRFNVYGHLDYIVRYGDFDDKALKYTDYKDIIDEILKTLISNGKGIELNTSGFRYNLNSTHPQFDVVKRYKDLGGEIITVGSDAHSEEYIASHFKEAYNILKELGFKYLTVFENQKPEFLPLH